MSNALSWLTHWFKRRPTKIETDPECRYYFTNNKNKSVDYILIYDAKTEENEILSAKRDIYLANLRKKKLEMELDDITNNETGEILYKYYKIHVPSTLLQQYCGAMRICMPVKEGLFSSEWMDNISVYCKDIENDRANFYFNSCFDDGWEYIMYSEFLPYRNDLFDLKNPDFFKPVLRSMVAHAILDYQRFDNNISARGLDRVVSEKVFNAVYPLHEGTMQDKFSERFQLLQEWGSLKKMFKRQPLDRIHNYFGAKVAVYFLWTGYYTTMLIPAAIGGLICVIYGLATLGNDTLSRDICKSDYIMCPNCDRNCDYFALKQNCLYAKITYVFDNKLTIVFTLFMSYWSSLYLDCWNRTVTEMTHHWGLVSYDSQCDFPRAEFQKVESNKKRKINFWKDRFTRIFLSFGIALCMVFLGLGVVFSIIIYRTVVGIVTYREMKKYSRFIIPVTAGVINSCIIIVLNRVYRSLAAKLTEWEHQRTQMEFNSSVLLKVFIFQFLNFYAPAFYIAFFKGNFVGYPAKYNRLFSYRQEECAVGGCLMELGIQLVIQLILKQGWVTIFNFMLPLFQTKFRACRLTAKPQDLTSISSDREIRIRNQVYEDFKLKTWNIRQLLPQYLDMVIAYGYTTLFVAAFPLAPLFCLFYNYIQIRLDAKKFLKFYRRTVYERTKGIGLWREIISFIGNISIFSNAIIIAFSSNFIQELVYEFNFERKQMSYLNYSLSVMAIKDLEGPPRQTKFEGITECRYPGFRKGPDAPDKYGINSAYWHTLTARLAFIIIFVLLACIFKILVHWLLPKVPRRVEKWMKKENWLLMQYLTNTDIEFLHNHPSDSFIIGQD